MVKLAHRIAIYLYTVSNNLLLDHFGDSPDPLKVEGRLLNANRRHKFYGKEGWDIVDRAPLEDLKLKRLPKFKKIEGGLWCSHNKLVTLEGCPIAIKNGGLYCDHNALISLKGCSEKIEGHFDCSFNKLTSLKFGPKEVLKGDYNCNNNALTELKGSPKNIRLSFYCQENKLTNLKGGPETVGWLFNCSNNDLTSLTGSPRIAGSFECSHNRLTSLWGGPERVHEDYYALDNPLEDSSTDTIVHGTVITDQTIQYIPDDILEELGLIQYED